MDHYYCVRFSNGEMKLIKGDKPYEECIKAIEFEIKRDLKPEERAAGVASEGVNDYSIVTRDGYAMLVMAENIANNSK